MTVMDRREGISTPTVRHDMNPMSKTQHCEARHYGYSVRADGRCLSVGLVRATERGAVMAIRAEWPEADRIDLSDPKTGADVFAWRRTS